MIRKIFLFSIFFIMSLSISSLNVVSDEEILYDQGNEICLHIQSTFNIQVGSQLPSFLPYGNEMFNIYDLEGVSVGHMKTEDKKIVEFDCTLSDNPTYNAFVKDNSVIDDINVAENKPSEFNRKIRNGEIKIEGVKFSKKTKFFFSRIGISIASWFS